jgi:membrane protein
MAKSPTPQKASLPKQLFGLLKDTLSEFNADKAPRLAAALAYYTAFSLAPLLVVVVSVAGLLWNREAVQDELDNQIRSVVGVEAADAIQEMVANADQPQVGVLATVIGVGTLVLGALGAFGQLQDALNTVWGVQPKPTPGVSGILSMLRGRLLSFTMVLGIGFLLLVSLALSASLAALGNWIGRITPMSETILQFINFIVSFVVVLLLFAMIYKILPDVHIRWRHVWVGAAVTSLLFSIGKYLIGFYLGSSSVASSYGAAGSFVVLLLWIYYSAMIFLFGAEFTQVYARISGAEIVPSDKAIFVNQDKRGKPGKPPTIVTEAEKKIYVSQPLTPQTAAPPPAPPRSTGGSGRIVLGIIAALATFLMGMLIASDQRHVRPGS